MVRKIYDFSLKTVKPKIPLASPLKDGLIDFCNYLNMISYIQPIIPLSDDKKQYFGKVFKSEVELRAYYYHIRDPSASKEQNWDRALTVIAILKSLLKNNNTSPFTVADEGTCNCGKYSEFIYNNDNICEQCMIDMYINLHKTHKLSLYWS